MSKTVKIINLVVFCAWISLLSVLLYKNYAGIPLEKPRAFDEFFGKETFWYGIYKGREKIGLASTTFKKVGGEIIIIHEREIKLEKDGHHNLLIEMIKCVCDSYFSIKSFEYISHGKEEKGVKITGEVDSTDIIFFLESPDKRKVFKIPTGGKEFYLPITFLPALARQNPTSHSAFLIPVLDVYNFSIQDVRVILEEIIPIKVGIDIRSMYKFKAGNATWWSNEKGIVVKEENPSGITLYSQSEKIAKDTSDRVLFDYTMLTSIKSNRLLPDVATLTILKVKIKGFNLDPDLYKNSLIIFKNDTLTLQKVAVEDVKKKTYKLPYGKDTVSIDKYLSHDNWVRSDYKPLNDTGRIFAQSHNNDAFGFTRYLTGYVFGLIRTNPKFVLSHTESILKSLSGDYLERTVMFASYSRAAGLPTRLVGGLIYQNGYFYFHTWPEVWFDKWIPADPTFTQFPADITHIPLKGGTLEDITSSLDDLETLKIEIMEAS